MAKRTLDRVLESVSPPAVLRRSKRSQRRESTIQPTVSHHLPSPSPSTHPIGLPSKKRKRRDFDEPQREQEDHPKRVRTTRRSCHRAPSSPCDRVAYWVMNLHWPELTNQETAAAAATMSLPNSNKRKSTSAHHSDRQQRLEENGIYMKTSALLQHDVLERIHGLNEARLQRDVTPWVVPSAENLFFSGCTALDYIGEEIQAEWIRCQPMGVSRPKPDFAVGLRRLAFREDELRKLENYATAETPFNFTPDLCFPFLVCEVKTGRIGTEQANTQNIHSASIAVRAIVRLFVAAYGRDHDRTKELLGRILAFSVSHNNRLVNLYGHYAVASASSDDSAGSLQFFRYDIAMFSLTMNDGQDRYKAYNFIRNLYDKFAPQHLQRIQDAVGQMAPPAQRTEISFAASDIVLDEEDSQRDSVATASQEDSQFRAPGEPASASSHRETRKMSEQMDKLLQQLEQQRKDSREQLEQQRKETRDKEERMERRLERQREESREQMEQIMAMFARSQERKSSL
ncbi:hypothetical protein LTR82_017950 [Friedmanniomyces endolithicus]|uniref:DUF7924 domain-containing protein n=1 Tax=Friedmanniomyces endolithicus TaxID=329885 RepID=A0AAN6J3U4_9PEZI|nr:hypothetical protein LTR82_017950 [Friedmanniomyces endolithicus]